MPNSWCPHFNTTVKPKEGKVQIIGFRGAAPVVYVRYCLDCKQEC